MKKYVAELLATFILVFCAAGSSAANEVSAGVITLTGCALVSGLIVTAMIFSVGEVSGAHLNPAVTIGFAVNRSFPWKDVIPYILCQCAGGIAGAGVVHFLFPTSASAGGTYPTGNLMQSFIMEFITTFILMFVIIRVASAGKEKGLFAGLAIGFVVTADILIGGPVSGGSMNPARSLGPALFSGQTDSLWLYFVAPVTGATIAISTNKYFQR